MPGDVDEDEILAPSPRVKCYPGETSEEVGEITCSLKAENVHLVNPFLVPLGPGCMSAACLR